MQYLPPSLFPEHPGTGVIEGILDGERDTEGYSDGWQSRGEGEIQFKSNCRLYN